MLQKNVQERGKLCVGHSFFKRFMQSNSANPTYRFRNDLTPENYRTPPVTMALDELKEHLFPAGRYKGQSLFTVLMSDPEYVRGVYHGKDFVDDFLRFHQYLDAAQAHLPPIDDKMPFGRHRGKAFDAVPQRYWKWVRSEKVRYDQGDLTAFNVGRYPTVVEWLAQHPQIK